jgi:molybdenum cofactor biosynthesis enzyme MoaA
MEITTQTRKKLLRQEQLDIIIGYACNAKCAHCIQEIRYQSKTVSDAEFLKQFEAAADYYFNEIGGSKVIITGGEPSIFPRKMLGILKVLQKFPKPEFVATYTNGSGLLEKVPGDTKTLLERAAEEGLTDINLSVHHYDVESNRRFHRLANLPSADVIANEAKKNNLKLRLNCNLIKEQIGSVEEIVNYLEWAQVVRPKDIYFRDLHRLHDRPKSTRFAKKVANILYVDEQRVDFNSLVQALKQSPLFDFLDTWENKHAGQGDEYQFDYKGQLLRVGYIDIGNENREQPTYFVFSPDGGLYADWNGPESLHRLPVNTNVITRQGVQI